jgi:hypothetical protein
MLFNINDSIFAYTGKMPTNSYHKYCKNIYSQNGEDGILEQLLNELCISSGSFCEFGASDGISSSNTRNLIEQRGFYGLYIEPGNSFSSLLENTKQFNRITCINDIVSHENSNKSLETYIDAAKLPRDFDVLSIDVDSYDYQIWEKFTYNPKIVIIEVNSYRDPIVTELNALPQTEMNIDILKKTKPERIACGTSFLPIITLGLKKGYIPVSFTGNIIFIRKDLISFIKEFPIKISSDPYDYLYLYGNLSLWDNKWYSCGILLFNTAVRNYYLTFKKTFIDLSWIYNHIETYGVELWNYENNL